ncbi:MAG TPA: response regulator [Verrucomicrobiae bacterium]|jgi:DNA-binding NtrC family response regulator
MSQPTTSRSHPAQTRKPLIYVVDDEPLLLDLAQLSLQADGYELKRFLEPESALKSFLKESPKPAILISDFAMRPINGLELIEKCKRAHPSLKTILISGTAGAEIVHHSAVAIDDFMAKPYQPTSLSVLVKRLLKG